MKSFEKRAKELRRVMRLRSTPGQPTGTGDKDAGVLILLDVIEGEYHVLLCVRSENLRRHPGEVCFPGGMRDDDDEDLQRTAVREAEEEVGISSSDYEILGFLPPFRARFGVIIHPTIALARRHPSLQLNIEEVTRCFWKPLSSFLEDADHTSAPLDARYMIHSFWFQEAHTYGVTALMSVVVAMSVLQRRPSFDLTPQVTETVMSHVTVDAAIDAVYFSASLPFKTNESKL